MADLIDEFRDIVKKLGGKSIILRPVRKISDFARKGRALWQELCEFRKWIYELRADYVDVRRHRQTALTDDERDEADQHVVKFINGALSRIKALQQEVSHADVTNKDTASHQYGVLLFLNDELRKVENYHKNLRDFRLKDSIALKELSMFSSLKTAQALVNQQPLPRTKAVIPVSTEPSDPSDTDFPEENFSAQELEEFQHENALILNEMNSLVSEVREAERKVLEISRMESIFEGHVTQQAKEIEMLYAEAVSTTVRVKDGNQALTSAKQRSSYFRRYILLFIILTALALLFLDWYQ